MRTAVLEVRAVASPQPFPRVGFVVPRYGRSAVARNQVKRRLREATRLDGLGVLEALVRGGGPPLDLVVRALPGAYARDYAALAAELQQAIRQVVSKVVRT